MIEPLDEIPHHMSRDNLRDRPREDVEEAARKWFKVASDMRVIQNTLTADLELALNLCQDYQRIVAMLNSPDPHIGEVQTLFTKYNMKWTENTSKNYGIYLDGEDITDPGASTDTLVERIELVADEDGAFYFRPVPTEAKPIPEWADGDDIEPVEDADLEWLREEDNELHNSPEDESQNSSKPRDKTDYEMTADWATEHGGSFGDAARYLWGD